MVQSEILDEKTDKIILNEVLESKCLKENDNFFVKYQGNTFEISNFLRHHPGGRQVLRTYRGLALDKVFVDVPHSVAAMHLFHEFQINNQRAYDDIEKLIDWNAPLLFQVNSLGDRYWEWVNLPVNRSIRLFKSDFLESLTVTPWYIVPIIWIPISIFFLYVGIKHNAYSSDTWIYSSFIGSSMVNNILAYFWGIILWTFLEYTLHRKLFHLQPSPNSKVLITLHFLLHGLHHKAPFDRKRLVFPPLASIVIATILYYLYKILFYPTMLDVTAAGTMSGYLSYDLIHYYLHHGAPPAHTYLYTMKRYHNYHHFTHHEQGFGISSKFWDYIFGSLILLRQLKKAIIW